MASLYGNVTRNISTNYIKSYPSRTNMQSCLNEDNIPVGSTVLIDYTIKTDGHNEIESYILNATNDFNDYKKTFDGTIWEKVWDSSAKGYTYAQIIEENTVGIRFVSGGGKSVSTTENGNTNLTFKDNNFISFTVTNEEPSDIKGNPLEIEGKIKGWTDRELGISVSGNIIVLNGVRFNKGETPVYSLATGKQEEHLDTIEYFDGFKNTNHDLMTFYPFQNYDYNLSGKMYLGCAEGYTSGINNYNQCFQLFICQQNQETGFYEIVENCNATIPLNMAIVFKHM